MRNPDDQFAPSPVARRDDRHTNLSVTIIVRALNGVQGRHGSITRLHPQHPLCDLTDKSDRPLSNGMLHPNDLLSRFVTDSIVLFAVLVRGPYAVAYCLIYVLNGHYGKTRSVVKTCICCEEFT